VAEARRRGRRWGMAGTGQQGTGRGGGGAVAGRGVAGVGVEAGVYEEKEGNGMGQQKVWLSRQQNQNGARVVGRGEPQSRRNGKPRRRGVFKKKNPAR